MKSSGRKTLAAILGAVLCLWGCGCASLCGDSEAGAVTCHNGVMVRNSIIDDNEYNRDYKRPGPFPEVKYITIHNTAEPFSARQERDRVNNRRDNKSVSFHFAVDENEAVQIMELTEHAWHAGDGSKGDGNLRSIGIEICRSQCYGTQEPLYRASEENAVKLTAWLLKKFNLSVNDLRKHQDWTGKYCPHRILDEQSWENFKQRVQQSLDHLQEQEG